MFANDGKHAFKILEQFLPDYIFLDINMPEMNGKVFLKELKSFTDLKSIPVIMFTTSDSDRDKADCKNLGALDFLSKPPNFAAFCGALKKYL